MSFVHGTFSVTCDKCGTEYDFDADESDFEPTGGGERQMGAENGYLWEHMFSCESENCDNEIEIEYEVYEYPVGLYNNDSVKIKGATENSRYGYDFQNEP